MYAYLSHTPRVRPLNGSAPPDPDSDLVLLLDGYRPSGGLARADEMASVLKPFQPEEFRTIARWIAAKDVVCVYWGSHYWLPLFQFDRTHGAPRTELRNVLAQLRPFDAWEIAIWFATPSPWLAGELPANLLAFRALEVEEAARATRFAVRG